MSGALSVLGALAREQGDLSRAQGLHEESLALGRRLADTHRVALELGNLAKDALLRKDYVRAVQLGEESLALHRARGSNTDIAETLVDLGQAVRHTGDNERAAMLLRESLTLLGDARYTFMAVESLEVLASILCALDEAERAARLLGAAAALRTSIGVIRSRKVAADHDRTVAAVREALDEEVFAAAWAAGAAMEFEEVIAYAIEEASQG
jgi:tetratricopeptide (TPR) repeat protein